MNPLILSNVDAFDFNVEFNVLEIHLQPFALKRNSRYRITLQKIKDTGGNVMNGGCEWQFSTIGDIVVRFDKVVLCDQEVGRPGYIRNLSAIAGDSSVTLSWLAPTGGGAVSYYKIVRSIDNQAFTNLKARLSRTKLFFTDATAQNGRIHAYGIITVNNFEDEGAMITSNAVTPDAALATTIPGAPSYVTAIAGDGQIILSWQAPISGGTASYYDVKRTSDNKNFNLISSDIPATSKTMTDTSVQNNIKYNYFVYAKNTGGTSIPAQSNGVVPRAKVDLESVKPTMMLNSQDYAEGLQFGGSLSFSKDATTLAVGEIYGNSPGTNDNSGTVQLFTKINAGWQGTQILTSPTPRSSYFYGKAVDFSPDGAMLAVSEIGSRSVHIYTKKLTDWIFSRTIMSTVVTIAAEFGSCVSFSPDSATLAVCDYAAWSSKRVSSGAVHLFDTRSWTETQILSEAVPKDLNNFGSSAIFSPDGTTIAIGVRLGDVATTIDAGTVHLYTKTGNDWVSTQILESQAPAKLKYFGGLLYQIVFSPDSKTLAIGEQGIEVGGNVQLFSKSGSIWTQDVVLTSQYPTQNGKFGYMVSFNANGQILAVSELSTGNVQLFKKSGQVWNYSKLLSFGLNGGHAISFSADGTLAVGNIVGTVNAVSGAGNISIFNPNILP